MEQFLEIALSFPAVIYTALLPVVVLYWGMVIVGAMDVDALGAADGLDGALDGAAEGAGEAAAEALGESAGEAGAHALAESGGHLAVDAAELLSALGLRRVPLTIVCSLVVIIGWVLSYLGARGLRGVGLEGALALAAGGGVTLVSLVAAVLLTSLAIRPLAPLFVTHEVKAAEAIVGKLVTVRSTRVNERFGQAEYHDGGAGLLLDVICKSENSLKKGAQALVVGYDRVAHSYEIAPYEDPTLTQAKNTARADAAGESPRRQIVDRQQTEG